MLREMLHGGRDAFRQESEGRLPWLLGGGLVLALVPVVLYLPLIAQIALPLSLLTGVAFVTRPRESLLAVFALRLVVDLFWWAPGSVADMNVMELFSGTVAMLSIALALVHVERIQRHPFALASVFLLIVLALASVRSGELRVGAEIVARFVSPLTLMFLVSVILEDRRDWERMLALVPAIAIVPVLLGFWHLANGQMNEYTLDGYNRLRGAYSNIHNHAHVMALFAVLGTYWMQRWGRSAKGAAATVFVAACLFLMFLTYVRTPIVGLGAFVFVVLLAQRRYKLMIAALAAFAIAFSTSTVLQDRFADVAAFAETEGSGAQAEDLGSGRLDIWTHAVHGWLNSPLFNVLFGLGLDQHRLVSVKNLDTHNDYLALLTQMGPIAVVTYLWFQALIVIRGLRLAASTADPSVRLFAQTMVGWSAMVLVVNVLSNSYAARIQIAWLFWGFAGLLFAMEARERAERLARPKP